MTISFCQCCFPSTVPLRWCSFPWFMHSNITLETVALDTPNNVVMLVTDAQLNAHQQSVLFQNGTRLPFSDSYTRTVTQPKH
jgi:hypothetical protein